MATHNTVLEPENIFVLHEPTFCIQDNIEIQNLEQECNNTDHHDNKTSVFIRKLQLWALKTRINHVQLNYLLKLLRKKYPTCRLMLAVY